MATADQVLESYERLADDEKKKAASAIVRSLPDPTGKTVNWLWLIIVSALAILLLGGTLLLFLLVQDEDNTEAVLPLVAGALGALTGLLAPSPAVDR